MTCANRDVLLQQMQSIETRNPPGSSLNFVSDPFGTELVNSI